MGRKREEGAAAAGLLLTPPPSLRGDRKKLKLKGRDEIRVDTLPTRPLHHYTHTTFNIERAGPPPLVIRLDGEKIERTAGNFSRRHHDSTSPETKPVETSSLFFFFFFLLPLLLHHHRHLFFFQKTFQTSICIVTSCALLGLTWFGLLTSSESYPPTQWT